MTDVYIWNPKTGITNDLDFSNLAASEIPGIKAVWEDQRKRLKDSKSLNDFNEKLSREWSIETGVIENLYDIDRGVTQTLIEHGFQTELLSHGSTNKNKEFVIEILKDQKSALDGIFDFVKSNRNLSVSYIKELHQSLLRSQKYTEGVDQFGNYLSNIDLIKGEWKKNKNFPFRDGTTFHYCPPEQVASEMDRLIEMHAKHGMHGAPTEFKAAWLHHRFTQIHPFQDGNGRVARAITSLVLVKEGLFPFVVTRDDKAEYIKSLEEADNNNLRPLINLLVKLQRVQFNKATSISENVLNSTTNLNDAIAKLAKATEKLSQQKTKELQKVFDLSKWIENLTYDNFKSIEKKISEALYVIQSDSSVISAKSSNETDYYFRGSIFRNANQYLKYYADLSAYRSWVSLNLHWTRSAKIVFTYHGMGVPFSGTMICAPFLEFRDKDENDQITYNLVPICLEGFVFFYNEEKLKLSERYKIWMDTCLSIAINEIIINL